MMKTKAGMIFMGIVLLATALLESGCFVKMLIPAPKRSFTANDLLVNKDELPVGWTTPWGPTTSTDSNKPAGAMDISFFKSPESWKPDITEWATLYPSIERAKYRFLEDSQFPGETEIDGWSFTSKLADDQKFSCYTYSNLNYPICTWLARYQEITIHVVGRLEPGRATLDEMQAIVKTIDKKVTKKMRE
jgi:hypothetical protein